MKLIGVQHSEMETEKFKSEKCESCVAWYLTEYTLNGLWAKVGCDCHCDIIQGPTQIAICQYFAHMNHTYFVLMCWLGYI